MKNKRIIAAAMAAGMAVSLAACGSSASTTDTNGSADAATTEAADAATGEGTGFSFANINVQEMTGVLSEAVNLYHNEPKAWKALQKNAMTADFSWEKSAKAYEEIYGWVTGK